MAHAPDVSIPTGSCTCGVVTITASGSTMPTKIRAGDGHDHGGNNLPPYYTVMYIMKVS